MNRRSLSFLSSLLALVLLLSTVVTASAYNNENRYHLHLRRLDPLRCGTPIGIQARLTDRDGDNVPGATIHFAIDFGMPGDSVAPANVVTDSHGKAVTYATLVCTPGIHLTKVVATGPNGARARIVLVVIHLHHHRSDRCHYRP